MLLLVAALTAILPASNDGISPALPAIGTGLGVPAADVAVVLSAFVIAFAAAQLFCGMLADAVGRRPIIFGGLTLYIAASVLGASAKDFDILIVARVLQGLGCAAVVLLARTIVRDLLDRAHAARTLAVVGALYGPVPILAPLISGGLVMLFGWRAPMLGLGILCAIVALFSLRTLPETLRPEHRQRLNPRGVLASFGTLVRSKPLLAFVFTNAFAYSGILLFSAVAPQVIVARMGESAGNYAMMFAFSTIGFIFGSLASSRIMHSLSLEGTLRLGTIVQFSGMLIMLVATRAAPGAWAALVLPQIIYTFGWGLAQSQLQAGALSFHSRAIGGASAVLGFGQLSIAGIIVAVFARLTTGSAFSLAVGMTFCAGMGMLCAWGLIRRKRETI